MRLYIVFSIGRLMFSTLRELEDWVYTAAVHSLPNTDPHTPPSRCASKAKTVQPKYKLQRLHSK